MRADTAQAIVTVVVIVVVIVVESVIVVDVDLEVANLRSLIKKVISVVILQSIKSSKFQHLKRE